MEVIQPPSGTVAAKGGDICAGYPGGREALRQCRAMVIPHRLFDAVGTQAADLSTYEKLRLEDAVAQVLASVAEDGQRAGLP
jgi:hypothetical protein